MKVKSPLFSADFIIKNRLLVLRSLFVYFD